MVAVRRRAFLDLERSGEVEAAVFPIFSAWLSRGYVVAGADYYCPDCRESRPWVAKASAATRAQSAAPDTKS
ncbi:hypothetical protein M2427_001458 [Bradyrhizobium sp. BR13661]|nr:hypothetical protein [Bradyrhizobium sp. BR13661]